MKRGRIQGYTKAVEKRLTKYLKGFVRSHEDKRAVFVTLTTLETDPEISKRIFQRWAKRVRRYGVRGVYVMEFNDAGQVHYHALLALGDDLASKTTESVAEAFWNAWKDLGPHSRNAFDLKPADLREPSWILSYMPKADIEPGVPHPQRVQKRCPVAFKDRGLRAAYWGVIGRSNVNQPFNEAADVVGLLSEAPPEAA